MQVENDASRLLIRDTDPVSSYAASVNFNHKHIRL